MELKWDLIHHLKPKKEDEVYQKVNVRRQLEKSGTEMRLDSSTEA